MNKEHRDMTAMGKIKRKIYELRHPPERRRVKRQTRDIKAMVDQLKHDLEVVSGEKKNV